MSYTDPYFVEIRSAGNGHRGSFARHPIPKGALLGLFDGKAECFLIDNNGAIDYRGWDRSMVMHKGLSPNHKFVLALVPLPGDVRGIDFTNHSCDPNCDVDNGLVLIALRDIEEGEELSFDYRKIERVPDGVRCWCNVPDADKCLI